MVQCFFYKSVSLGGQGRRKLVAIPPDVNGYTGRLIRNVSSAGKTLLYVVPLQQNLDLTPLPSDAAEFQTMPKASCQVCKESMPLHILALHVNNCVKSQSTEEEGIYVILWNIALLTVYKYLGYLCT